MPVEFPYHQSLYIGTRANSYPARGAALIPENGTMNREEDE